jgi:oxygen-independent coproporphyrinogen III oxidase
LKLQDATVLAICSEIRTRKNFLTALPTSIYFGGGSPSILSNENLNRIFESLRDSFDLSQLDEVTLESNPDDHNLEKLSHWKSLGINRLSIGIQSFINRDLKLMNRAHSAQHAIDCVGKAKETGFTNLTIDLIYGIPGQSFEEWSQNVKAAIDLNTDHISAYCLTVEPKTALDHQINKGLVTEKSDEEIEREYLFLHESLEKAGFKHYEISNYAKSGKEAKHNANYWSGKSYLGIGPSAHSFDGRMERRWNISNNALYIKHIQNETPYFESEVLTERERINEEIMTGLRTAPGFQFSNWPLPFQKSLQKNLSECTPDLKSKLILSETRVRLKPEFWLIADAVIRELIILEDEAMT